jgi:Domain of unknown function (DUF5671)
VASGKDRRMSESIDAFVRSAKGAGVPDSDLVALLRHQGWAEDHIYGVLAAYYTETLGIAPPLRSARGESARDAFMYVLNFITLGFWTIALGNLCYVLIARALPDVSENYRGTLNVLNGISWQLASIIIALPAFLWINSIIERELKRRPDLYESPVRLWLTYIALAFAALLILIDAIWFLESLLQGQITIRFVLDSLVLLAIGGGIFTYYFAGMRPNLAKE